MTCISWVRDNISSAIQYVEQHFKTLSLCEMCNRHQSMHVKWWMKRIQSLRFQKKVVHSKTLSSVEHKKIILKNVGKTAINVHWIFGDFFQHSSKYLLLRMDENNFKNMENRQGTITVLKVYRGWGKSQGFKTTTIFSYNIPMVLILFFNAEVCSLLQLFYNLWFSCLWEKWLEILNIRKRSNYLL